jgi:hypothetical protein
VLSLPSHALPLLLVATQSTVARLADTAQAHRACDRQMLLLLAANGIPVGKQHTCTTAIQHCDRY